MSARPKDVIAEALHMPRYWPDDIRFKLPSAILSALAAAGYVIEQDWQTIETAPRDGTRFIAWWQPCAQVHDGRWHECQWRDGGWYHPFFTEPTHWKPPPVDAPHLAAAIRALGDAT